MWAIWLSNDTIFYSTLIAAGMFILFLILWVFVIPSKPEHLEEVLQKDAELSRQVEMFLTTMDHMKISNHSIFNEFDNYLEFYKYRYDIGDPGRTLISREMMYHKVLFWKPILEKLASDIDECFGRCHGANIGYCNKMRDLFTESFMEGMKYVSFMDSGDIYSIDGSLYTDEDKNLMREYMKVFSSTIHRSKEVIVEETINSVWSSTNYVNCIARAADCYDIYAMAFKMAKMDSEALGYSINGKFEGRIFLGTVIGPPKK